jgi:hypothetical protein
MRICCLAGALVLGGDVDDAGVDVKGDSTRHAARGRRDSDQVELAERLLSDAISRSPWKTRMVTAF